MLGKTMCVFEVAGEPGLVLTIHHPSLPPSHEDWQAHVDALSHATKTAVKVNNLVMTDGQGPNSAQRRAVADLYKATATKAGACVVSSSAVARGIITALRWLGIDIIAFPPERYHEALAELGCKEGCTAAIATLIAQAEKEFGKPLQAAAALRRDFP